MIRKRNKLKAVENTKERRKELYNGVLVNITTALADMGTLRKVEDYFKKRWRLSYHACNENDPVNDYCRIDVHDGKKLHYHIQKPGVKEKWDWLNEEDYNSLDDLDIYFDKFWKNHWE